MVKASPLRRSIIFLLLAFLAASTLLPIVYMVSVTFLTKDEYLLNVFSVPSSLNIANYRTVLDSFNFLRMTANSVIISTTTVFFSLFFNSLCAYSLVKLDWKGKSVAKTAILVGMFMPGQVLLLPVYQILISLKLVDTMVGLIMFYVAISVPFAVMMMMANLKGLSNQVMEAAQIDGASSFMIYLRIVIPLLKPTLATATILNFIGNWNELLYAMILLQSEELRTVTVSVVSLTNKFGANPPLLYAGLLMSALPVVLVYLIAQKQIVKGVSSGAVK